MTKSDEGTDLLDPMLGRQDLKGSESHSVVQFDHGIDGHHLASILAFLGHEIDQSAAMLRDLARSLSHELCALDYADGAESIQQRLIASTVALQNEDRVQQRLGDLRAAMSVLEKALVMDVPNDRANLDRAIINQLCLEEIRGAFALSIGMDDELSLPISKAKTPSLGDVDLF